MSAARPADGLRAPSLDGLEHDAEVVLRKLEWLLERARLVKRVMEDCDEGSDVYNPARAAAAQELRLISRMLTRAWCDLVPRTDERYVAARQVHADTLDADRLDGAWLSHTEPVQGGIAA